MHIDDEAQHHFFDVTQKPPGLAPTWAQRLYASNDRPPARRRRATRRGGAGYFPSAPPGDEGEEVEATVEEEIDMEGEDSFTAMKDNFLYLLDLFAHPDNQMNKSQLTRVKQLYLDRDLF